MKNARTQRCLTHVAGATAVVDGHTFQRCSLCGDMLLDSRAAAASVGAPPDALIALSTFQPGVAVCVHYQDGKVVGLHPVAGANSMGIGFDLPADSCYHVSPPFTPADGVYQGAEFIPVGGKKDG